jgi:RNA polymerase sigma-54 factor
MTNDPAPEPVHQRDVPQDDQGPHGRQEDARVPRQQRAQRALADRSIEQRKSTIQRVIRAVVDAQREFFDKGPEFLKPLPMISVADQLGIHVATVSRAVSEKWIQTPRGVFPLRRSSPAARQRRRRGMSWDAVKEKLKVIIDDEDKHNPLNDDEIVEKLQDQGIDLARRTGRGNTERS